MNPYEFSDLSLWGKSVKVAVSLNVLYQSSFQVEPFKEAKTL